MATKTSSKRIDSVQFYHSDPRNILNDVNSIPELYYLANLTMSTGSRSKINSEIPLLIGYEAYSKLINYYGGTLLYVPTREELQSNLLGVMSYYYYSIKGLSWNDTAKKLNVAPTKGGRRLLRNRWKAFRDLIDAETSKVPDLDTTEPSTLPIERAPVFCEDMYLPKDIFGKALQTICTDLVENRLITSELSDKILARYE